MHANVLAAGATPQTPLGELTALPRSLDGFGGMRKGALGSGKGKGEKKEMGKEGEAGVRERRNGKGPDQVWEEIDAPGHVLHVVAKNWIETV